MCGIAGIVAYHPVAVLASLDELRRIRDHMARRGPDGLGEWLSPDGRTAFGHRRLSIIDLSESGAQPMRSADGRLTITYNGEIYNYRALRQRLEAKGCQFRSESDTEVLLHLYAELGEAMLLELRGMFAFALHDAERQATLLARDPYGIKPLYYADDGWTLRFASQVKALLAGGGVSRASEPAGITGFYIFGSVPEPFTLYQDIRALPAGSSLWVRSTGPSKPQPYFFPAEIWAQAEHHVTFDEAEAQHIVREALRDSVRHHLVSDVPVAAFLSAGIDSGALVGLISEESEAAFLSTLTLSFAEYRGSHDDEAPLAAQVAAQYGARHTVRVVDELEFRADLPDLLQAMDQPSIDGINTWFISKAAREAGIKVAISGLGGDELFGGYPSFKDVPCWVRALWLPSRVPGLASLAEVAQSAFAPLFRNVSPKFGGLLRYGGSYEGAYLLRRGLFLPKELSQVMEPELAREGLRRLQPLAMIGTTIRNADKGEVSPRHTYGKVALMEASIYMRNQLLRDTDWASMAHSLEVRTPLVDATLLRALVGALTTPFRKRLLADAPSRPLPDAVRNRRKSGFTTPIAKWQKRLDGPSWREKSALRNDNCPWARRWAWSVMQDRKGFAP